MEQYGLGLMMACILCGCVANYKGKNMAIQLAERDQSKYVMTLMNPRLAKNYRREFGSNSTYWSYLILNAIHAIGFVVIAGAALLN